MPSEAAQKVIAAVPACKDVWPIFMDLVETPRGSYNPTHIIPFFKKFCAEHKLECIVDKADNVLVRVPATPGCEDKPGVCLQGHWDIVNQKDEDVEINFKEDPLVPRIVEKDGKKWVMATGTSLGSDDGIGVAMALSIALDKELKHGPLEVLITRDEEVGLIGASALEPGFLKSKYLINIDSEDFGILTISCAGGFNAEYTCDAPFEKIPDNYVGLEINIKGFHGGHSGVEINQPLLNGIKGLIRVLRHVFSCNCARLIRIDGGSAHNAIPRDACAKIAIPKDKLECVKGKIQKEFNDMKSTYAHTDPNMTLILKEDLECKDEVVPYEVAQRLLGFMTYLPACPLRMSPDVAGLVETSFTEAVIKTKKEDKQFYILGSGRSSIDHELDEIYNSNAFMAKAFGFTPSEMIGRYGAWPVCTESKLTKVVLDAFKREIGTDMKVEAIHAGLECGCIIKTHPSIDAVSLGPTLIMPHSPSEALLIETVIPTYKVLEKVVSNLAE